MTDQAQQGNNQSASAQGAPRPTGNKPPGTEPRGAGSGRDATATRDRNIVDWPPEPKSHAEHVEELLAQAQANEDFNNEMNQIQTDAARKIAGIIGRPQGDTENDEEARANARQALIEDTDVATRKARLDGEMKARARGAKEKAADKVGALK